MSRQFYVRKRLSLAFLGEGWDDCYIDVRPLSPESLKEILQQTTGNEKTTENALRNVRDTEERLARAFIDGKGLTDDGLVELEAGDIRHLPLEVTNKLTSLIMGEVDPNLGNA